MDRSARNRGFTLIELMIVVAIIAILATIGLTVYSGVQRGARDSKRQADLQEIQKALEQYYASHRFYPVSNSHTSAAYPASITSYFSNGDIPHDPLSSLPDYNYISCSTDDRYVLCTGANAMETCTGAGVHPNCNANAVPAAGSGCGQFTSGASNTFFCVGSLSN